MSAIRAKMSAVCFSLVFLCLGIVWCVPPAAAHRVTVFAWVEGETVHVESKFSGGKRVANGQVIVSDLQGNRLLEGRTDATGAFSFKLPKRAAMRIELIAGMGHRGEWLLTAEEVGAAEAGSREIKRQPAAVAPPTDSVLKPADVERIVEAVVDRKLQPITRMLAEARETGPSPADIFGGLGYILGLVGLATYIRYRKQRKDPPSP